MTNVQSGNDPKHPGAPGPDAGPENCQKSEGEKARETMLRFCSLGENCEFGQAQRMFGAEPLDLFRWTNTHIVALIQMLRDEFSGLNDPDQIEIVASGHEYMVCNHQYGCSWHSWALVQETTPEVVHERERKRLPYLAKKLIEEIATASRIFVVKREHPIPEHVVGELLSAMHRYGPAQLVHVDQGGHRVVRNGQFVFHAWLPKFADPATIPSSTPGTEWLRICEDVLRLS